MNRMRMFRKKKIKTCGTYPITIGCDHRGVGLKNYIVKKLQNMGYTVNDCGTHDAKKPIDYPDIVGDCMPFIKDHESKFAILICGSGIGVSICANRYNFARAALCVNKKMAMIARQHNDANVLCMGASSLSKSKAFGILKAFLSTRFVGGRHDQRVSKLYGNLNIINSKY